MTRGETEFCRALDSDGLNEVWTREMPPDSVLPEHTHAWDARLVVLKGEMRLERDGGSQAERYGPVGTALLIGRRHPS